MSAVYQILDEPKGSRSSTFIVNPFWPLLGFMFGGAWLGAAFFALNAWLLKGPTWRREIALAAGVLVGSLLIFIGIAVAVDAGALAVAALPYAMLIVVVWKLAVAYWIYFLQQNPFAIHEYFNAGALQTGRQIPVGPAIVVVGAMLRASVIGAVASPFWAVVVS